MPVYSTHLTNEALPEPGTLLRVVSVHPGNRTFETAPVGHDPGWLVADPAGTNNAYWTDGEVSEEHPGWVRHQSGVPAAVISRHGAKPDPEPSVPSPRPLRRGRRGPEEKPAPYRCPTCGEEHATEAEAKAHTHARLEPVSLVGMNLQATENTGGATNVETTEEGNDDA